MKIYPNIKNINLLIDKLKRVIFNINTLFYDCNTNFPTRNALAFKQSVSTDLEINI